MIRTRVGYCGGETRSPTYDAVADHTETIEIDFDPERTSYQELLDVFFSAHDARRPTVAVGRSYRSAVFYHDDGQRRLAETACDGIVRRTGRPIATTVEPIEGTRFWLAERHHQKFHAQQVHWLAGLFDSHYETTEQLVADPATTRVNAAIGGHLDLERFERDLPGLGLPPPITERLLRRLRERPAYR